MAEAWVKEKLDKAFAREYTPEAVEWRARLRKTLSFIDRRQTLKEAKDRSFGLFHVFTHRELCGRYSLPNAKGGCEFGLDFDLRAHEPPEDKPGACNLWASCPDAEPFVQVLRHFGYENARWEPCNEPHRMADWGGCLIYVGETLTPLELCGVARRVLCEMIRACDITAMDKAMLERAKIDKAAGKGGKARQSSSTIRV